MFSPVDEIILFTLGNIFLPVFDAFRIHNIIAMNIRQKHVYRTC